MILLFILFIKNLYFIIGAQLCTLTCSYHIDRGGLIVAVDKNFIIIIIIMSDGDCEYFPYFTIFKGFSIFGDF